MGLGIEVYDKDGNLRFGNKSRFTNVLGFFEIPVLRSPLQDKQWLGSPGNFHASGHHVDQRVNEGELFIIPLYDFASSSEIEPCLPKIYKDGNGISWAYIYNNLGEIGGPWVSYGGYKVAYGVF